MKSKRINVPLYDFRVDLIEVENKADAEPLLKYFRGVKLSSDIAREIIEAIENGDVDGGWTISNFGIKRILVVLLKMRTDDQRRKVLSHEKRHVEDDILEHASVNDKEAAAYLAGYLGEFMY